MNKRAAAFIFRRLPALLLIAALCAGMSGCGKNSGTYEEREQLIGELYGSVELAGSEEANKTDATTSNFMLPYTRSDNFNPYMCESTLNAAITDLMYDQLIDVNNEFEAEMVMATQIVQTGARLLSVTLRDGIVFSDGTEVSGRDIKYSFQCAKADGSRYQKQLRNISGCMTQDNEVYFRLENPDPRAYMLLDFPIVKNNSANSTAVPIGSGRYVLISDVEKGTYLERNEQWFNTNRSDVKRVSLVSMPTVESIVHSIEIGTITYYYTDLRDGYPSRLNANYSTVDINNLIFLGVNTADDRLTQFGVRSAINAALNREEIITGAYAGRAYSATGPLTTSWPQAAEVQSGLTIADTEGAVRTLQDIGYVNQDERYIRSDGEGKRLEFTILVNSENSQHIAAAEMIATQLAACGMSVTVEQRTYTDYRSAIAAGEYTLYLGEYSLFNNMDFAELFTPNSGMYYGLTPQTTIDANNNYRNGTATLGDLIEAFDSELPFIPVCYRLGMVCYSRSLSANMDVTESNLFMHMNLWNVALADTEEETEDEQSESTENNQ